MQKRAKIEVYGNFLKIDASDGLDIAYYASTKCFSTLGYDKRACISN